MEAGSDSSVWSFAEGVLNVLHVGCGRKQYTAAELFAYVGLSIDADATVTHLDADAALKPDIVCRLGTQQIPLAEDSVDAIVAWHVLEHIGQQGQTAEWFRFWEEAYRVLKPGGWIYAESPNYDGIWAWSDPTHSRAMSEHALIFFMQAAYRQTDSMISPYRIRCDFQWQGMPGLERGRMVYADPSDARNTFLRFALKAIKPFRGWWED